MKRVLAFTFLLLSLQLQAQRVFKKASTLNFQFGIIDFSGKFLLPESGTAFSISYMRGITKHIDFSLKENNILYQYALKSGRFTSKAEFGAELELSANIRPWSDNHFFAPYLTAGIGQGFYTDQWGTFVPLGIGVQGHFKNNSYIFLQTVYRKFLNDYASPSNLFYSIGFAATLARDEVIEDLSVMLPNKVLPPNIIDKDGDGITDSIDACPDVRGTLKTFGCPDTDNDGIADKYDSCLNVRGVAKYHGCPPPDSDNDSIIDDDDKCPLIKGFAKYLGCPIPDTDGDGINDEEDQCVSIPGSAKYMGCPIPDTDSDSINDENDKCPAIKGSPSNYGCPVINISIIKKVNFAAKNILFVTGSSKLLPKSFAGLNTVAKILNDNPSFNITIEGHTDNTGNAEKNKILSQKRSETLMNYLVSKGVIASRIVAKGFGSEKPVASNKTKKGKAQNRRVELKLKNY